MPRTTDKLKVTGESVAQVETRLTASDLDKQIAELLAKKKALTAPEVPMLEEVLGTKLPIALNGVGIFVDPCEFSKGSYGYSLRNKSIPCTVNGKKGVLTVGVCAVFKGSKPKS